MSNICGWSGKRRGPDMPQQVIGSMLAGCHSKSEAALETAFDEFGALAICEGLYNTSFFEQDGTRAVLIGTPYWDDPEFAEIASRSSPAASLIRAYRNFGTDLFARLHGPFALAVQDRKETLVAVDRLGIHRLSYTHQNGLFVFATDTGSIIGHPDIPPDMDPQAVFNYFYFHDIPSPGTYFKNVEKVLPAQYVLLRDGRIQRQFYWRLNYNAIRETTEDEQRQQLHSTLRRAVTRNSGDHSVATFLSGGTDSSTITGILAQIQENPVDAYSIGFGAEGFDEMEYARLAAIHFGALIHEYYLKPEDILEAIPVISRIYDEPFGNDSAVPTYFCAKQAAENGVQIMLAGDGGDEIFGGNERYAKQMVFEHYGRLPNFLRKHLFEPITFGFPGGDSLFPIRKLRSYISQAKISLPERMESYNFVYRQSLQQMFEPEFLALVDPELPKTMLQDTYFRTDSEHPVNRMMHLDLKFTLADNDLRKVSRTCEAVGVEVRYPLLDEEIVEFSANLPPHYMVKGNKTRVFFKQALKDFLPDEIITKSKHGFGLPVGVWALSHPELRDFVESSLNRVGKRGFLRKSYVQSLRDQHANVHPTYFGKMIWVMMMLEQWLDAHRAN